MSVVNDIFSKLQGKPLDEKDVAYLRSSFDLQHQMNEQLKAANEALKESIKLKSERIELLEKLIEELRIENENVKAQAERLRAEIDDKMPLQGYEPSGLALEVLKKFRDQDLVDYWEYYLFSDFRAQKIEFEAAMHDLQANLLVKTTILSHDKGRQFSLTQYGRQYVLSMEDAN